MRFKHAPNEIHVDFEDDVEVIIANSAEDFVNKLHTTARFGEDTREEYLRCFAEWNQKLDDITLRYDTPENFVQDLIENGYLKVDGTRYELHTQPRSV